MEKTDRRIVRTRRLLGEALLELIQEQTFDSITIRDITINPGANVSTRLDVDIYQVGYSYSFFQDDRLDLAIGMNLMGTNGGLKGHRIALEFVKPVYQDVDGPQLESDYMLIFGYQKIM